MKNLFLKLICSLPSILLFLYFFPFIGILLIFMRALFYRNQRKISTPIILICVGIFLFLPEIAKFVFESLNIENEYTIYVENISNLEFYQNNLISYAKYLISAGVILLVLSLLLKAIFDKVGHQIGKSIQNYAKENLKQEAEISKENDLKIKIKQEKAKNTNYVKCPYCGADNLLSEKFGTCQYCRRKIENKKV